MGQHEGVTAERPEVSCRQVVGCSHRYRCRVGRYHRRWYGDAIEIDAKPGGQRPVAGKDREDILGTNRPGGESFRRLARAKQEDERSKESGKTHDGTLALF